MQVVCEKCIQIYKKAQRDQKSWVTGSQKRGYYFNVFYGVD